MTTCADGLAFALVGWPDWWVPFVRADTRDALVELSPCAEAERVEVVCNGGHGRSGTALACMAVLDGVPKARDADLQQPPDRYCTEGGMLSA